jgi:hypothetical protein
LHDQALCSVEEAQTLRHVVESRIEACVLDQQARVGGVEGATDLTEFLVAQPQASGVTAGTPQINGHDDADQQSADQNHPGTQMGGASRPARNRRRDECPAAVCDLEVTRPVQTLGKRRSRQRRGRAGSRARAVKVERGCTNVGILGKKIEIQTHRHGRGCEDILDHDAGLKHALGKADEIAPPILDGVVRQAWSVHRQHDKKAVAVAFAPAKNKIWTGGRPVFVPRAFERALP